MLKVETKDNWIKKIWNEIEFKEKYRKRSRRKEVKGRRWEKNKSKDYK